MAEMSSGTALRQLQQSQAGLKKAPQFLQKARESGHRSGRTGRELGQLGPESPSKNSQLGLSPRNPHEATVPCPIISFPYPTSPTV